MLKISTAYNSKTVARNFICKDVVNVLSAETIYYANRPTMTSICYVM